MPGGLRGEFSDAPRPIHPGLVRHRMRTFIQLNALELG